MKIILLRDIIFLVLHPDQTPEIRVTRSCGWVKHKRECYTADNKDHLETVCQCFGDVCNAGNVFGYVKVTILGIISAIFLNYKSWRKDI